MRLSDIFKLVLFAVVSACVLSADCECCDDYVKVERTDIITKNNPEFVLEAPGANKDCHARFRLEVAWKNSVRQANRGEKSPYLDSTDLWYNFFASRGSFVFLPIGPRLDSTLVAGIWWYNFYWTMDTGAKNETNNPTTYGIRVWCRGLDLLTPPPEYPDWWDVTVHGKIEYVDYDPGL